MLRLTPMSMASNVANALAVVGFLWTEVATGPLLAWAFALFVFVALGTSGWARTRNRPPRTTASPRATQRAALHAAILALTWGFVPAMWMPEVGRESQLFLGVVTTGLICAGGFALSSVPGAGTTWVTLLGVAGAIALGRSDLPTAPWMLSVLLGYCAMVVFAIWSIAGTLEARLVAEAQADRQNEVIGLLLRDFEDTTSDLLWELDHRGRFTHVSPRLAAALDLPERLFTRFEAERLLARRVPKDEESQRLWRVLHKRLAASEPFRDLVVSLQTGDGVRWWSLSARAVQNAEGRRFGWRGVAADITDKHLALCRLKWLAHNDALTGLVNRTEFRELLRALLFQGGEKPPSFAILALDLDGFKQVNDSRGHAAGDLLLQSFGRRLLAATRKSDTVARLGGDEFAILLRGPFLGGELRTVVERVAGKILAPESESFEGLRVRTSIGVAVAPDDGADVDTLMNHADIALYAAKHSGGSRVQFFHLGMAEKERRRAALERGLRGAVERNEFHLEYQPQISLDDWRLVGFEALLRWTNPDLGVVSPAEFVPVAEEAGLMQEIGAWVLREACDEAARWPEDLRVSINVAAPQLSARGFVELVLEATSALSPQRVELEVTESALIDDTAAAVARLNALRSMGYHLALDDFGTGYSALGYLRHFAFDTLKIDRSFVRDIVQDEEAQVILETILAMSRALGMVTVAEGVETTQEADLLRSKGCALLQGYLVARPLGAAVVPDFIERWQTERMRFIRSSALQDAA